MENRVMKIEKPSDTVSEYQNETNSFVSTAREKVEILEEHVELPDLKEEPTNINSENSEQEIVNVHSKNATIKSKICYKCSKSFNETEDLNEHLWDRHKIGSLKCDICNKILKTKRNFAEHCKRHENLYPYKCEICPAQFFRLGTYKTHIAAHKNKMPCWCMKCGQCFMRVVNCKSHEHNFEHASDIRAKITGEQNVKRCDICKKNFYNLDCLNEHVKFHPVITKIAKKKTSKEIVKK